MLYYYYYYYSVIIYWHLHIRRDSLVCSCSLHTSCVVTDDDDDDISKRSMQWVKWQL